jgi:mycothiol synthase
MIVNGQFTLRPFHDDADYEAMAKVKLALRNSHQIEVAQNASELKNVYTHFSNFDIHKDLILAELNGKVLGFCRCGWEKEVKSSSIVLNLPVYTHPESPQALDQLLFDWGYSRLQEIYAAMPEQSPAKLFAFGWENHTKRLKLFEANGLKPIRYYHYMRRDLLHDPIPELSLPSGITVRPSMPSDYRKIWEAFVIGSADEWGSVIQAEEDFLRWQGEAEFQPFLWQIGWFGDQPVGMVNNYVNLSENEFFKRHRGYTESIWVLPEFRKKGLASALIARSLTMFKAMNMHETALGVDTQNANGALGLYEGLGYKAYSQAVEYSKPFSI